MQTFIICGYGIPKDIHQDQNYLTYLNIAFNKMYSLAANKPAVIIPSGGATNCTPPFEGTEAAAMEEYLHGLMNQEEVRKQTKDWKIILEDESLSTLENFLFAKKIINENELTGPITFFCEQTRNKRLQEISKQIFLNQPININSIDFDTTKNRYLDPKVLNSKEAKVTKEAFWALKNPENLAKHHKLFEKKFEFLRRRQNEGLTHVDAVKEWFEKN